MKTAMNTIVFTAMLAVASFAAEVYYNLHEGWNMLAMPCSLDVHDLSDYMPVATPVIYYSPDSSYYIARNLSDPCKGFWALADRDSLVIVGGEIYDGPVRLELKTGWNLIAMPDYHPGETITSLLPIIGNGYFLDPITGGYAETAFFPPPNTAFWVLCSHDYSTMIDYDSAGFDIYYGDSVARNIELKIYSDGWGDILDSCVLSTEKDTSFNIYEEYHYGYGGHYYYYARADGFFTETKPVSIDEVVSIDLDPIPPLANSIALVFIGMQGYFADHYVIENPVSFYRDDILVRTATTDSMGRVFLSDLPLGDYRIELVYLDPVYGHIWGDTAHATFYFDITNTIATDFYECRFYDPAQFYAPNIYLYPETTSVVDVSLVFDKPGHVTASEPPYGDGWSVTVEPSGLIDGEFGYLFYEADYSTEMNIASAWTVRGDTLEVAFRKLLGDYGCIGREIEDFVDFWMPHFTEFNYYLIYPQEECAMVGLEISPEPDNILRVFFVIRGFDTPVFLAEPAPPAPFIREGFTVVEWGVSTDIGDIGHGRSRR